MLHPALKAFFDAHADRFPDLTIIEADDRLTLEWGTDEVAAFMFSKNDEHPSFEVDDMYSAQDPDHLAAAVQAFAIRLSDPEAGEVEAVEEGAMSVDAEPGTFGALVWTKAIDLRLVEMAQAAELLRAQRACLNPTTIADLPLFARDGDPVDADDCDPHGPSVQCHACAAEE